MYFTPSLKGLNKFMAIFNIYNTALSSPFIVKCKINFRGEAKSRYPFKLLPSGTRKLNELQVKGVGPSKQ
jgi:hypothetical protein